MLETYGNIWELYSEYDAMAITTNGFVKKNGEAVMGRGVAKEAVQRFPEFPGRLGYILKIYGNIVWPFDFYGEHIIFSFPVKPQYGPDGEMGWKVKADINLIKQSAHELVGYADGMFLKKIILPRPGCGNGGLKWADVKKEIEPIFDDRFTVVTNDYRNLIVGSPRNTRTDSR